LFKNVTEESMLVYLPLLTPIAMGSKLIFKLLAVVNVYLPLQIPIAIGCEVIFELIFFVGTTAEIG